MNGDLALRELEAAARLGAAVLLTLDGTAVAGEEAFLLQGRTEVRLEIGQRLRDAVTDGTGLAGETAADDGAHDIELAGAVHDAERLVDDHAQDGAREVLRAVLAVDGDDTLARLDPDAGDRVLALAGGVGAALGVDLALVARGGFQRLAGDHAGAGAAEVLQVGETSRFVSHLDQPRLFFGFIAATSSVSGCCASCG